MRRVALAVLLSALACSEGSEQSQAAKGPDAPAAVGETISLPSGVRITHRVIGTGPSPSATGKVSVHYDGTFPDGKVFDSGDATFPLNQVIPCWTEGVQMMKVGGKAQLICPPQTAYGANGQGPIPPDATLHFEVELHAIQ